LVRKKYHCRAAPAAKDYLTRVTRIVVLYDTWKDLILVTLIAKNVGYVPIVYPRLPARSVKELVALAKAIEEEFALNKKLTAATGIVPQ
jgi:tripartite-type tricarboxylate transporter receptor subunit TctC